MRLVTAMLLMNFEVSFSKDHDPEDFWKDMTDRVTNKPGNVWCNFKHRV